MSEVQRRDTQTQDNMTVSESKGQDEEVTEIPVILE